MTTNQLAEAMAGMDVPVPDESERNWAKWVRSDGGCVIFRANVSGDWGTLDVNWREADGRYNGLYAPKRYSSLAKLERDIRALLAVMEEIPSRELLEGLGK